MTSDLEDLPFLYFISSIDNKHLTHFSFNIQGVCFPICSYSNLENFNTNLPHTLYIYLCKYYIKNIM